MRLTMTMSLPQEHRSATRARHVLTTLLGLTDAAGRCRDHLAVLITEACANAILHAGRDAPIEVAIALDDTTCTIEVGNSDASLDRHPFPAMPAHPLAESGRGLPLIAALADSAEFSNPRPGWLVLRMTKRLTPEVTTGGGR
jgi:serine/threonine-protein kinase RsbW